MSPLKEWMRETALLYRDYSRKLAIWAEDTDEQAKLEDRLADLALMETEFMERSHEITRNVDEGRRMQSRRVGHDVTLHEWARSEGILPEF